MPMTSKQKTDTRKAAMTEAAREDGFFNKHGRPSWSLAITAWLRREARLVRVKAGTCRHGVYLPDGDCVQCLQVIEAQKDGAR